MSDFIFSTTKSSVTSVYASDGTVAGTRNLGVSLISQPSNFTVFGGKLYFIGPEPLGTGPSDRSLEPVYSTDGTAAGTMALKTSSGVFQPDSLGVVGARLLASGYQPLGSDGIYASSDGINLTEINNFVEAFPIGFIVSNGVGFFSAGSVTDDYANQGIWRTDGTAAGTYSINPPGVLLNPQTIAAAGKGLIVFINPGPDGGTLWVTNGTAASTAEIKNAALGTELNAQINMVSLNGKAYFEAINAAGDYSVWGTDGASGGTMQVFSYGSAASQTRPGGSIAAFGNKLLIVTGDAAYIYNGSTTVHLPLTQGGSEISPPSSYAVAGNKLFLAQTGGSSVHPQLYVSDGTVAGTVPVNVAGLVAINGPLSAAGNSVVFDGTDTSGRQALFRSDGTTAGSKELGLPAGITVDATTVIAALPVSTVPPHALTGMLPNPLYTGTQTVTGSGGVAGLQLERITQGTYNTPGSLGWVKATVQANGNWSAPLVFDKPGQLAHVFAENGGSKSIVDLVNGTPTTSLLPLTGKLPNPLHVGEETITGTGGVVGLRLERITQGTYNTPGQTGWVTAAVAADHSWSAELIFTKPGLLAHVYAQNGGSGTVVDLVNGIPIAKAASGLATSVAADMTAKASIPAPAQIEQLPRSSIPGSSLMPVLGSHVAAMIVPEHAHASLHIG